MRTQIRRFTLVLGALLGVLLLVACEQAAELIPDAPPPTATPEGSSTATASPTPIIVNPDGSVGGNVDPSRIIPDHELAPSVVQILVADNSAGFEQIIRSGSGVVVDAEAGLIATAYPVVDPRDADGTLAYSSLIVAISREAGAEPTREFVAELATANPSLDLAVLRITGRVDGAPLDNLGLVEVVSGDPTSAGAGFNLRLFGYPGLTDGATSQVLQTSQGTIVDNEARSPSPSERGSRPTLACPSALPAAQHSTAQARSSASSRRIGICPQAVCPRFAPSTSFRRSSPTPDVRPRRTRRRSTAR